MRLKKLLLVFILGVSLSLITSCDVLDGNNKFEIDKVGIILYGTPLELYSKDYYMFFDLEEEFSKDEDVAVMYKDNVPQDNVERYLEDFANRQYDVIFVENKGNSHEINEVAKMYPDTIFVIINNDVESVLENVLNINFDDTLKYELSGYLSGSLINRENLYYPYKGKAKDYSNKIKKGLAYYEKVKQLVEIDVKKKRENILLQEIYAKHAKLTNDIQSTDIEDNTGNNKNYTSILLNGYILADVYFDPLFIKTANEEGYGVINIGHYRQDSKIYTNKEYSNNASLDIYYSPIYKATLNAITETGELNTKTIDISEKDIYGLSGNNVLSNDDLENYIDNK